MDLGPGEYIFTQEGDVLAFTNEKSQCALGYNFDITMDINTWPSVLPLSDNLIPDIGNEFLFMPNALPYDFAIGALYDLGKELCKMKPSTAACAAIPVFP